MKEIMTYSILAYDQKTGTLAGAAATGSLCVGGWVLRGDIDAGLVASQGTAPSTFWRDGFLRRLHAGETAKSAMSEVIYTDNGRAHRQLIGLDRSGETAGFTGDDSVAFAAHQTAPCLAVAGNMLNGPGVLESLRDGFLQASGDPADRLITALSAAKAAGGDSRGLLSAALLVLSPNTPPLDLRIDHAADPLADLAALLARTRTAPYADWLSEVPVRDDRSRSVRTAPLHEET